MSLSPRAERALLGAAILATSALCYGGGLANGFVYDDLPQVVQNPWIRDPAHLLTALLSGSWAYAGTVSNYYRPVMHAVYTGAYALFGLAPAGFHLVSVALHAGTSLLVFSCGSRLLRTGTPAGGDERQVGRIAAVAALAFAAHPVHTEAVSWVGGVPDLCAALFVLAALRLHASLRPDAAPSPRPRQLLALACFLLAALSKEIALVFPALVLAWDAAAAPALGLRRRAARALPYAGVAALYLLLRWNALGSFAPVRRHPELGPGQLALNGLELLARYLEALVLPLGLSAFHPFHPVTALAEPRALAALAVAALVAAALAALARAGLRRAILAALILLLPLLPALYVPAVGENPFAERYLYLPSVGFVWLLALGAQRLLAARPRLASPVAVAALGACAAYGLGTAARQPAWRSDRALWEDAAAKAPEAPIPHHNLGVALAAEGDLDRAAAEYKAALRFAPSAAAFIGLGATYQTRGQDGPALDAFQRALALDPRSAPALNGIGTLLLGDGQTSAAVAPLRQAAALAPSWAAPHHNLGLAYERLGLLDAARESYRSALRADPSSASTAERLRRLGSSR